MKSLFTIWIPNIILTFSAAFFGVWVSKDNNYQRFTDMHWGKIAFLIFYFAGLAFLIYNSIKGQLIKLKFDKKIKEKEDSVSNKKEELRILFTKEYEKKENELNNERYKVLKESERLNILIAKKLNIKDFLQIVKNYRSACDDFGQHHHDEQAAKNRFLKAIEELRTIQEYLPLHIQKSIENLNENNLPLKNDMQDYSKLIIQWLRDDLKLSYN